MIAATVPDFVERHIAPVREDVRDEAATPCSAATC